MGQRPLQGPRARLLRAVAVVLAATAGAGGCTFFSADGAGGLDETARRAALDRARALSAPNTAPGASAAAGSAMPPETPAGGDGPAAPGSPDATTAAGPRILDLASALELADRHNRSIAASEAAVDVAAGQVAATRAALLPTHTIRGQWQWYSDEQTNSVTLDPALNIAPPTVTVREDSFGTASVAARLAVDLSGELRRALSASQAAYRAEQARAWATRLDEEKAVASAYFRHLEAIRLQEVGEAAVALYERQLADATAQYEQGRLTRNGVLVVEVTLSNARQEVRRLGTAVAASRRALARATGLDVDADLQLRDVAGKPGLPDLASCVATAEARNPVVTAMLEEVRAADDRLSSAKRSRLPRFAASAGYDATTVDILRPNDYASAGAGVEFDLYSPRREGEIASLEAATRRARSLLDRSAREVESMVRDAHDALAERLGAVDAAVAAVGQAEENVRIRRAQFDQGRATSEDLLDASQLLVRQRAQAAAALYQAHVRRAELQQATGEPLAALALLPQGEPR